MADTTIFEKDMTSKLTLDLNDFIRITGWDNVSYKQLVSDVAKVIVENYDGTSLGGSERTLKNAIDGLNSSLTSLGSAFNYGYNTDEESKELAAATADTVLDITLPSAGTWLVLSYMNLDNSGTGEYDHILDNRVVRSSETENGGSVNWIIKTVNASTDISVDALLETANTVTVSAAWIRLTV